MSLGRRSSSYTKPGGPKSDPRPISDKAYQANCVRVLIAYLSAHGYDQPLAPKLLASPMSKDVTNIVQFLMRQVRRARPPPDLQVLGSPCPTSPRGSGGSCRWRSDAFTPLAGVGDSGVPQWRAVGNRSSASALQVDPNLVAKSMGKIEDDVPVLYKRLRYPFGISKSALFAVGSPHTWPGLLAALTWLVELLNYEEKAVRRPAAFPLMPAKPCR